MTIPSVSVSLGQSYSFDITQKKSGTTTKILLNDLGRVIYSKGTGSAYNLEIKPKKGTSSTKISVDDISKIIFSPYVVSLATINTPLVSSLSTSTVTLGANIITDGNSAITERGVVWSTNINPTTANNLGKKTATGTTGQFTIGITGLTAKTLYHFRGYAVNSLGTAYTNDSIFTTLSTTLADPVLQYPENNSYGLGSSITFKWGTVTGASSYNIQMASDSNFKDILLNTNGIKTATKAIANLSSNSLLFWRVRGEKTNDTSGWSKTWSFTTASASLLKPIIIYPTNNAKNVSIDPILRWKSDSGITSYDIIVSDKSDLSNIIYSSSVTDTLVSLSELKYLTSYYWKIIAKNDTATSEWGAVYKFTTHASNVGIDHFDEIPSDFSLLQNYPNPFNPNTVISYSVREPVFVSIKIYDIFGREVETLVNEFKNTGNYRVIWEPKSKKFKISTGTYFYHMKAGNYFETKKMLYLR